MKLWELHSVLARWGVTAAELPARPEWERYREAWDQADDLLGTGERRILDEDLPDDFVLAALERSNQSYFLDGTMLRSRPFASPGSEELSAVEAARRFGGSILEEVQEFGAVDVIAWKARGERH